MINWIGVTQQMSNFSVWKTLLERLKFQKTYLDHKLLHTQYLIAIIGFISDVDKVFDFGRPDLLEFTTEKSFTFPGKLEHI